MTQQERRWLWVVLGLALLLRLGWGLSRPADEGTIAQLPDQREYLELGRNLLRSGELKFFDERFGQDVYAYRTPGYPLFVATMGGSVRAVRAAQAMIDTSTVLAVYLIARRWLAGVGPLAAAAVVAFNPLMIYFSGLVLTETIFTTLLTWAVLAVTSKRSGSSILLALGVMVRPSGALLAVALPAVGVWVNSEGKGPYLWRRALAAGAVGGILLTTLFALWGWRNQRVLGEWVWTTTNEGITRYDGFNERATGASDQWFVKEMPRLREMDEVQRDQVFSELSAAYINAHPGRVGELAVRKVARTWSPVPLSEQFGSAKYVIVGLGYTAPFLVLVLAGLWLPAMPRRAKVLLMTPAVYFTLVHAFSVGSLRYRVPAEPQMAVVAASAVATLVGRKRTG